MFMIYTDNIGCQLLSLSVMLMSSLYVVLKCTVHIYDTQLQLAFVKVNLWSVRTGSCDKYVYSCFQTASFKRWSKKADCHLTVHMKSDKICCCEKGEKEREIQTLTPFSLPQLIYNGVKCMRMSAYLFRKVTEIAVHKPQ